MFYFFKDGNKKASESYYTIHNLKKAQKLATGKGVKIGIIDWLFGDENNKIFSGNFDATGCGFVDNKEHGFAMAKTLKEIAPNCQVFAINGITKVSIKDDNLRVSFLEKALEFAIQNGIQILTYSHQEIQDEEAVKRLKQIIKTASKHNIITIFLHCNIKGNIMPLAPNVTKNKFFADAFYLYQYDYNFLNPVAYKLWLSVNKKDKNCFLSWSSMAPVLAGFVAMFLESNPKLTREQIVEILVQNCVNAPASLNTKNKIIDIFKAVNSIK